MPVLTSTMNNLGTHPQMGWNTWNKYHCDISGDLVKNTSDSMVSLGLSDLGYNYLIIDDCW